MSNNYKKQVENAVAAYRERMDPKIAAAKANGTYRSTPNTKFAWQAAQTPPKKNNGSPSGGRKTPALYKKKTLRRGKRTTRKK